MATTFTRMDESTAEQWALIGAETMKHQPRVAEEVLSMLSRLEAITDGFATDQLVHSLQTATLAEAAGADQEVIVASLCHDIGKVVSVFGHPDIAAAILAPYVRAEVSMCHWWSRYSHRFTASPSRTRSVTPCSSATRWKYARFSGPGENV